VFEKRHASAAKRRGRDVETDEIHQSFVPRGRVDHRAPLEQQRSNLEAGQAIERGAERIVCRHLDLGASSLELASDVAS